MIEIGGARVALVPECAVWLTDSRSLLVADLHLGKAQSFRRAGIPVPAGTTAATLGRLDELIGRHQPAELIVLGDFLHGPVAQQGPAIDALAATTTMRRATRPSAAGLRCWRRLWRARRLRSVMTPMRAPTASSSQATCTR